MVLISRVFQENVDIRNGLIKGNYTVFFKAGHFAMQ